MGEGAHNVATLGVDILNPIAAITAAALPHAALPALMRTLTVFEMPTKSVKQDHFGPGKNECSVTEGERFLIFRSACPSAPAMI